MEEMRLHMADERKKAIKRKEAIREYKGRKTSRGIYSVRCTATDDVWVGAAPDLDAIQNRILFSLLHGNHGNKRMQATWKEHGEQSFQFQIVEKFDEDVPALMLDDLLKKRKEYWITELNASTL
jgi:hypothetical protein